MDNSGNNSNSGNTGNTGNSWSPKNKIISVVFTCVILALVIYFLMVVSKDYSKYTENNPYLIRGTKIATVYIIVLESSTSLSLMLS